MYGRKRTKEAVVLIGSTVWFTRRFPRHGGERNHEAGRRQETSHAAHCRAVARADRALRAVRSNPRQVLCGERIGAELLAIASSRLSATLAADAFTESTALGESLPIVGKLLGHTQVQNTASHVHLARDTVKAPASHVGDSIGDMLASAKQRDAPVHPERGSRPRSSIDNLTRDTSPRRPRFSTVYRQEPLNARDSDSLICSCAGSVAMSSSSS